MPRLGQLLARVFKVVRGRMATPPQANWYDDPDNDQQLRWWDGQQWTEYTLPKQQHHTEPAPVATAPQASPSQSKKTVLIAAATAGVLLLTTGVGFGAYFLVSNSGDDENIAAGTGAVDADSAAVMGGYEFLPTIEDHPADEPLPLEVSDETDEQLQRDVDLEEGIYDYVEVFVDSGLTRHASTHATAENGIEFTSQEEDEAQALSSVEDVEDGRLAIKDAPEDQAPWDREWGQYDTYYVVQHIDEDGEELDTPTVQPYRIAGEKLASVDLSISEPDEDGNVSLSWDEVEGASDYVIVSGEYYVETKQRKYGAIGKTSETEWSSEEAKFGDDESVLVQNDGLEMFETHAAEAGDEDLGPRFDEDQVTEHEIGVIAVSGDDFSPLASKDARSALASLPYTGADDVLDGDFLDADVLDSLDDIDSTNLEYVSLDGSVRKTRMEIVDDDFDTQTVTSYNEDEDGEPIKDTVEKRDVLIVPVRGAGTMLSENFYVDVDADDIQSQVQEFNDRALADAPKTGEKLLDIDSEIPGEGPAATGFAEVSYPVHGSNEFVEYLASNMLDRQEVIDVSGFVGKPGMPETTDALFEALYQNPYIVGDTDFGISGDNVVVEYSMDEEEYKDTQAELSDIADSAIDSIIDEGMSDEEKAIAVNDWVVDQGEYDYEALDALENDEDLTEYSYAWDATGIMMDGEGVCSSYAVSYSLLADAAGLDVVQVIGDIDDGLGHAWNKVNIDGDWLAIDPTWNDDEANPNQYVLISDDEFVDEASRTERSTWMSDVMIDEYATR